MRLPSITAIAGELRLINDNDFMQHPTDDYGSYDTFPQSRPRTLQGLQGPSTRGGNLFPLYDESGIDAEPEFFDPGASVRRVRLNAGGYDRHGTYYGAPIFQYGRWMTPPLWVVTFSDGREEMVRAESREAALAQASRQGR